jgi:hypothetical protein
MEKIEEEGSELLFLLHSVQREKRWHVVVLESMAG